MGETSWEVSSDGAITVEARYISSTQIVCEVPDSEGSFQIRITNNGVEFSSQIVNILNFDTQCYECSNDGTCFQKVRYWIRARLAKTSRLRVKT